MSDSHLHDVIQLLSSKDVPRLFRALNINSDEIEKAEMNASTSEEKSWIVLQYWRHREAEKATRHCILSALETCGNKKQKEQLDSTWNHERNNNNL